MGCAVQVKGKGVLVPVAALLFSLGVDGSLGHLGRAAPAATIEGEPLCRVRRLHPSEGRLRALLRSKEPPPVSSCGPNARAALVVDQAAKRNHFQERFSRELDSSASGLWLP